MNNKVAVRQCREYDPDQVFNIISEIYRTCEGPDVAAKRVLVKPNLLMDSDPSKCITTHPVVVEAMVRFLQSKGATVVVGDSPAVHLNGYKSEKSGINDVCVRSGAAWVDFIKSPSYLNLRNGKIRIASAALEADVIVSLPKFKTHELVYFTGMIKNSLGLVPGFSKVKQHALHYDRQRFSVFLVDLNEALTPHFFLMDGIMGMEGQGPGQGTPIATDILLGSTNPLAADIIASTVAGYNPLDIPTNAIALSRRHWLKEISDIEYDGPEMEKIIIRDFKRVPVTANENIALKFIKKRLYFIRRFERRPHFIHEICTGCQSCIRMCPAGAITMHDRNNNRIILNDRKCIRCFCCAEVCQDKAVVIKRKF